MPTLAAPHAIRRAARAALGAEARPLAEIVAACADAGLELGPDAEACVLDALEADRTFFPLDDDRVLALPRALEGIAFATDVPPDLAAHDCLPAEPDLVLLAEAIGDASIPLAGRAGELTVEELDDGEPVVHGPPGWLAGLVDTLVALRLDDGACRVAPVEGLPDLPEALAGALRRTFDAHCYRDELHRAFADAPVPLAWFPPDALLAETLAAARSAFTDVDVVAPLDMLLTAAGLARVEDTVMDAAADPRDFDDWQWRKHVERTYGLGPSDIDEVELLLSAFAGITSGTLTLDTFGEDEDAEHAPDAPEPVLTGAHAAAFLLGLCLMKDTVARVFIGEHMGDETPPQQLADFARTLLDYLDPPEDTGARWLLAWALDRIGEPLAAEAELEVAARSGVDHALVLRMLAGYRSDRGDAPGALALLRRATAKRHAGRRDDEGARRSTDVDDNLELLVDEVEHYANHRPPPRAGRNEPCPCGSGRKYKVCHAGRERHPLVERGPWLYDKAQRYLRDHTDRMLGLRLAQILVEAAGGDVRMLADLAESPLVSDIALHEGGAFAAFLAERDAFLPDDEALTAARWALVERSVFEIEHVGDETLTVRDLRSGERIVVASTTPGEGTRAGDRVIGRPLPVAETWRAFSGLIPVRAIVDEALAVIDEGDPFAVAEIIGRCLAPPVLTNTAGEPMVFHELTYRIDDGAAAAHTLATDARLTAHDDGTYALVRDTGGMDDAIVLTFELADDELVVRANSDARAAEARALVEELLPDAALVDHDHRSAREAYAQHAAHPSSDASTALDPDDPEVAELLERVARAHEERWVDESIPALGGLTPREALTDPTRRADLERLLAQMDALRNPGAMDAGRVRTLLGM